MVDILPLPVADLKPTQIGVSDGAIAIEREDQGYVDVDALANGLSDSWYALLCGRNLNHQVGAINHLPEAAYLSNSTIGIMSQVWRNLQADIAIVVLSTVVNWA